MRLSFSLCFSFPLLLSNAFTFLLLFCFSLDGLLESDDDFFRCGSATVTSVSLDLREELLLEAILFLLLFLDCFASLPFVLSSARFFFVLRPAESLPDESRFVLSFPFSFRMSLSLSFIFSFSFSFLLLVSFD